MHIRDLVVEVRDKNLVRLGQITEPFLDILIEDQFNNVGSWELRLPSSHPLAPALRTPGAGIVVTSHDGETLFSGPIVQPEDATTVQEPAGIITVKGLSDSVILADRLAFPEPSNVDPTTQTESHDVRTGAVETLMHEYVNANIGPGAPSARRHPHLQMGTDGGRGSVITKKARFPVLGELLAEMAAPEGLGFRVVQVDDHLEFQTYEIQDRTDGVRLDVRNNNLAGHRVAIAPPGATHVVVAGQGELTERTFRLYTTEESLAAADLWGRRIERFVDQRQTDDPDELDRAGLEVLAEEGFSQISVQVVPMENFSVQYGHDWSMGDQIVVVVRDVEMSALVTGYVLRNSSDGFRMGAILGDPARLKQNDFTVRMTKLESRVSNLERGVETVQDLGVRLGAVEGAVNEITEDLVGIGEDITAIDGRLSDVESDVAAIPTTPPGVILAYAGSSAPSGWLLCDGSAVSRTTYSDLFAVIGTTYGNGNGSTTFNLPNLKGRVPVGLDASQSEFDMLGETGGAKRHTLTAQELPDHVHGWAGNTNSTAGNTADSPARGSGGQDGNFRMQAELYQSEAYGSSAITGDRSHNNLQPYIVLHYIIKT